MYELIDVEETCMFAELTVPLPLFSLTSLLSPNDIIHEAAGWARESESQ